VWGVFGEGKGMEYGVRRGIGGVSGVGLKWEVGWGEVMVESEVVLGDMSVFHEGHIGGFRWFSGT
jgi:hypothetical protein